MRRAPQLRRSLTTSQAPRNAQRKAVNITDVSHQADETSASVKVLQATQFFSGESRKLDLEVKNFINTARAA